MSPAKKQTAALKAAGAKLTGLPIERLRAQFEHAFGKPAGKQKRVHLVRAIAEHWTTEPAPTSAAEHKVKSKREPKPTQARDPRLPKVGATLKRTFKGRTHEVTVLHDGFRYAGKDWRSLTSIAKEVTGYPAISGPLFWGITKPATEPKAEKPAAPEPAKAPANKRGRPISTKRKE